VGASRRLSLEKNNKARMHVRVSDGPKRKSSCVTAAVEKIGVDAKLEGFIKSHLVMFAVRYERFRDETEAAC